MTMTDDLWRVFIGQQSRDFKGSRMRNSENRETLSRSFRSSPIPCTLSYEEAQEIVDARTAARRNRDFELADQIRDELTSKGIEVVDKENVWRTFDRSLTGYQSDDRPNSGRKSSRRYD